MYLIEKTDYGIRITFAGFIRAEEMQQWYEESAEVLADVAPDFKVLVDIREMNIIPQDSAEILEKGQQMYEGKGMLRSVVITGDSLVQQQLKRLARESGIFPYERYIDASSTPDWEKLGVRWLERNIDPEL